MEHIPTPQHALAARPWTEVADIAPPKGDETGIEVAHVARGVDPDTNLPVNYAHFALSDVEVAQLVAGGTIELALIGYRIQPFGMQVCPAEVINDAVDLA